MKTIEEIRKIRHLQIDKTGEDGVHGFANPPVTNGRLLQIIASWGGGWDHVSVSLMNRCPTWEEMAWVKKAFFRQEECAVEYHPPETSYVNRHPYCLHIWRPQEADIPMPPTIYV